MAKWKKDFDKGVSESQMESDYKKMYEKSYMQPGDYADPSTPIIKKVRVIEPDKKKIRK